MGKAAVVGWTAIMLFLWLVGTSIGVASRWVEQVAASTGSAVLGLSIVHGFMVAAGRARGGEIVFWKSWSADRLA
jgi:hypothetical protein